MFSAGASSLRAPSTIARITAFGVLLTFFNIVTGVCTTNELRFALVVSDSQISLSNQPMQFSISH